MNNFTAPSLAPEQRRAGYLSSVEANAKATLLDAFQNDVQRIVRVRDDWRDNETAADVLLDSATHNPKRLFAFVQLLVDGANGADIRLGLQVLLSTAVEQFAQGEVEREQEELS